MVLCLNPLGRKRTWPLSLETFVVKIAGKKEAIPCLSTDLLALRALQAEEGKVKVAVQNNMASVANALKEGGSPEAVSCRLDRVFSWHGVRFLSRFDSYCV